MLVLRLPNTLRRRIGTDRTPGLGIRAPCCFQSFGNLAASAVAGILWTVFSPTVAFIYIAAWMVAAVALLLLDRR